MDWNLFAGLASYVCAASALIMTGTLVYYDHK